MTRPGIGREIFVAAGISVAAAVLLTGLNLLGTPFALRTTLVAALAAYTLALLSRGPRRSGRFTAGVATLTLPALVILLGLPLTTGLALSLAWTWLVRCFLWHRSLLAMAADAALTAASTVLAMAAFIHTGSLLAGLWCLLFAQAFHVLIPPRWPDSKAASSPDPAARRFDAAEQRAHRALSQLFNQQENAS